MRVLIIFGTTEGHTREVCQFAARLLRDTGVQATLEEATPSTNARALVAEYDAFLIAASLHVGRFQPDVVDFARRHHEILNSKPSAFISISLSAAGHNPDDWQGLDTCVRRFLHETSWKPSMIHHAAGAIRFSQYDFFKRLAMKHIARERGLETSPSRDYDLTDYEALGRLLLNFARQAQGGGAPSTAIAGRGQP